MILDQDQFKGDLMSKIIAMYSHIHFNRKRTAVHVIFKTAFSVFYR